MVIVMIMLILMLVPSVRKCVCGKKRGQATSRRLILGDTSDELAVDNPVFDGEGEDELNQWNPCKIEKAAHLVVVSYWPQPFSLSFAKVCWKPT